MIEMDMPKLEVLENDDFYAKVVCEPLEKGFGLTIGNCFRNMRRICFIRDTPAFLFPREE